MTLSVTNLDLDIMHPYSVLLAMHLETFKPFFTIMFCTTYLPILKNNRLLKLVSFPHRIRAQKSIQILKFSINSAFFREMCYKS